MTSSISVIIPVYNGSRYLGDALESVFAQDHRADEVIVVDDGSTDDSVEVASRYPEVKCISQPNRGPAAARNTGLAMANGDVIAFLDSDDYWPRGKLRVQLGRMASDPEIEIVLGRMQCVGLFTEVEKKTRWEGPDNTRINVCLGSGVFKRTVFDKVGHFDESLRHYEDHDWYLRAREHGVSMVILKHITLIKRLHENNMSRHQKNDDSLLKVLKKSLDRRRDRHDGSAPMLREFFDYDEADSSSED